jgi:hypothetical protein
VKRGQALCRGLFALVWRNSAMPEGLKLELAMALNYIRRR